ncbi:MAG: hypothetical protein QOG87_296 [Actinomycetota bacterium]
MANARDAQAAERLEPGTRVEVRQRFDQHWSRGFEVADAVDDGYKLKRLSDGSVLPVVFDEDEVRPEKKKSGLWWY